MNVRAAGCQCLYRNFVTGTQEPKIIAKETTSIPPKIENFAQVGESG